MTLPCALLLCLATALPAGAQPQPPLKKANTITPATTETAGKYLIPGTTFAVSKPVVVRHRLALTDQDLIRIHDAILRSRAQFKENITDKPNGSLTGKQNVPGGKNLPKSSFVTGSDTEGGNAVDKRPGGGLGIQGGAVTPNQYRDTYAGDRINGAHEMDTHNYGGNGSGQKSDDIYGKTPGPSAYSALGDQLNDFLDTLQAVNDNEGGGGRLVISGDPKEDVAEASYAMSVGPEHYQATKDMSWSQRADYINKLAKKMAIGGRENPDADPSGKFHLFGTPAMRQAQLRVIQRALAAHKQKTGGGQDPRTQHDNSSGGQLNMVSKDDRVLPTKDAGKLDWDLICRINSMVNPPRQ